MSEEIKTDPKAEVLAKAKAERERIAALNKEMATAIGKKFTDGERTAAVVAFEPSQMIGPKVAPAYLVNLGNPNANHFIHCDEFNQQFKTEVKG